MRAIAACLALAACATGPPPAPPARLAGCWINRDVGASTMRWLPDQTRVGVLNGARTDYVRGVERTRYTLEPSDQGWSFCELDAAGAAATRCWVVAEGEGGSLEGGRVFIDAHGDRLRIEVVGAAPNMLIFQGRRDGCD